MCETTPNRESDVSNGEPSKLREVRYEYSRDFPRVLEHLGAALVISTYQAGKLAVVGLSKGQVTLAFHNFERVMGVAVSAQRIAVGAQRQIYFLQPARELAASVEPRGTYDACWLARNSLVTGNIHGHEMAWGHDGLWLVNTLFSCLCTLEESHSFVPRWRPPFVGELAAEDRCHLNGIAMRDGRPQFVTAHSESNEPAGWRPIKATSGCVIDVPSGQTVARGLCMPHSPRWHNDRLWALDSGTGRLVKIDPADGRVETIESFPGYARGLDFAGQFAFVGLSKIRETSIFGGIPIAENRDSLRCAVAAVDLVSGRAVARFEFCTGVEEIFAVSVLLGCRNPVLSGPAADEDGRPEIWLVPPEKPPPIAPRETAAPGPAPRPSAAAEGDVGQLSREAAALHRQGRLAEAVDRLKRATGLAPSRGDLWNEMGNVCQDMGDQETALTCYQTAAAADPRLVAAHQNLGYLTMTFGDPEEALRHYAEAQRLDRSPMNRLLAAMVLPVVYESADEVRRWRTRYETAVRQLAAEGVRVDAARSLVPTPFYLAYQGLNDREVAADLGRLFRGVEACPAAGPPRGSPHELPVSRTDDSVGNGARATPGRIASRPLGKIKVGFLSAYFRDHTIGRLNLGRIQRLSRERFEVAVIYAGRREDDMTRRFRDAADRYVALPREVDAARRQIADLHLDLLLFTDVGMDALTYTLSFSRMATVQCATWGHPDTTGSPAIDYFLSSELLETPAADAHYTERLVRLPNLGTYYQRPQLAGPARNRAHFGLPQRRRLYMCPQTLFKFHPDFDVALAGILRRDPEGELVLVESSVRSWMPRLERRWARTLGEAADRVRFLPAQPTADYLQLMALGDVALDPFPFGGGNTSYEALAVGTPVVTLPGEFLRGRITAALYRKMGMDDCQADSVERYVELAVQLAADPARRAAAREKIRRTSGVLFDDPQEVRSLEQCFRDMVDQSAAAPAINGSGSGNSFNPEPSATVAEAIIAADGSVLDEPKKPAVAVLS